MKKTKLKTHGINTETKATDKDNTTQNSNLENICVLKAGIPKRKSQFSKLSPASVQF
jgi:hypothetical protein